MYLELFESQAEILKAIAHPRRLEIIHLLRDQNLCVTDIYAMLDLPQANISQHLMILRDAEIVRAERDGKQMRYSLAHPQVIALVDTLKEVMAALSSDPALEQTLDIKLADMVPLTHDLVCGMRISPKAAHFSHMHHGKKYYFCASGCLKKFQANPEAYV